VSKATGVTAQALTIIESLIQRDFHNIIFAMRVVQIEYGDAAINKHTSATLS